MRFRNETADDVAYYMVETKLQDLGKFARGQLFNMLQLKHQYIDGFKSTNNKVNLWDILPAWELLICYIGVIYIDITKIDKWCIDKVGQSHHFDETADIS